MTKHVIVVGAGIVGLAHAWMAARMGCRVTVVEQSPAPVGASIRNFGMVWPIGQASATRALADRSRALWQEAATEFDMWHDPCGSLHLAHADDELLILDEFQEIHPHATLLTPSQVLDRYPWVNGANLAGGLFSDTEMCVFPPQALASLFSGLAKKHNVQFLFETSTTEVLDDGVMAGGVHVKGDHIFVCTGQDHLTLLPGSYKGADLIRCRLQMMRTSPVPPLGVMVAGGLTLAHYAAFQECPSIHQVVSRLQSDFPEHFEQGIHILISQHEDGRLTIGDSHHYGNRVEPFNSQRVDDLILEALARLVSIDFQIEERWQGVYLKRLDGPYLVKEISPTVTLVNGVGGAGMTMSFGLAEQTALETLKL